MNAFGNLTTPFKHEVDQGDCRNLNMQTSNKFQSATLYRQGDDIVGLQLAIRNSTVMSFGLTEQRRSLQNQTNPDTETKPIEKRQVSFSNEWQPIGLFGTSSANSINSLGFIKYSSECKENLIFKGATQSVA